MAINVLFVFIKKKCFIHANAGEIILR